MLSLPKILALAGVVWLVFYLFRKMDSRRHLNDRANKPDSNEGKKGGAAPDSLDLEECRECGAWVSGQACDRAECPYRSQ